MLEKCSLIFWDFDGVIKESLDIKSSAFESLFLPYGQKVSQRIRQHHNKNQGVSRFEKIPLYLGWAGETVNATKVDVFCQRFSDSVSQAIINSPWVPGVREYLLRNFSTQYFVLVTATPQKEIERILAAIAIRDYFREVHGAPTSKVGAMESVLLRLQLPPSEALFIGDTEVDLKAAQAHEVPFLLRCTPYNKSLQACFQGPKIDNFNNE